MPEEWRQDDDGYTKKGAKNAAVLGELFHKTKNQILLEAIVDVVDSGNFKGRRVGVDGAFGRDHKFLDSRPKSPHLFRRPSLAPTRSIPNALR
jgi:hypothetical protein